MDHQHTVATQGGELIGVGDRVATRRNDPGLGVANRDTWTVTTVHPDGSLAVKGRCGDRVLPTTYVADRVELAYATTIHGAQGDTADTGHLLLGDHTTAQAAYVGMTRGRNDNTVHVVAAELDRAREQWISVFDRQRADLGPAAAAEQATVEAANYAPLRPLDEVFGDFWGAWSREAACDKVIAQEQGLRRQVTAAVALTADRDPVLQPLRTNWVHAEQRVIAAEDHLHHIDAAIDAHTETITADLRTAWQAQRPEVRRAADTVIAGTGLFGHRHSRVDQAAATLTRWAQAWEPAIGTLPDTPERLARLATGADHPDRLDDALARHARRLAEHAHPEREDAHLNITRATQVRDQARDTYRQAAQEYAEDHGPVPSSRQLRRAVQHLRDLQPATRTARAGLEQARADLAALAREPALRAAAPELLEDEHWRWTTSGARAAASASRPDPHRDHSPSVSYQPPAPSHSHGIAM